MGVFDFLRRGDSLEAQPSPNQEASGQAEKSMPRAEAPGGTTFEGLGDPAFLEFMRGGVAGEYVHGIKAMRNMAVLRSLSLISESIGMLPINLMERGPAKRVADDMDAHRRMKLRPNGWQTPYEFKSGLQLNTLVHGNGYARVIWSRGKPLHLIPMESDRVQAKLTDDWRMAYKYTRPDGGVIELEQREVFHLRDLSADGELGMSRVKLAKEAISLSLQAQKAAARLFSHGVMAGGAIEVADALSDKAYERMRGSLDTDHAGAENAGKWMLLEEGAKAAKWASTAVDAQHNEQRSHQIEEVARAFGVPRPLLMMDETAWGSGIEQLGIFFVQYGLQHWFTAWEQAAARVLLSEAEQDRYFFKFNERALMRGTLKDQADYFAKSLGAGGQAPWTTTNEVRDLADMPRSNDPEADKLRNPMTQPKTQRKDDEPPETT